MGKLLDDIFEFICIAVVLYLLWQVLLYQQVKNTISRLDCLSRSLTMNRHSELTQ